MPSLYISVFRGIDCLYNYRIKITSFFLPGIIMVGVIVGSKKTGINPDNVATPIAASFGDLITLAILAWISQGLYSCLGKLT